MWQFKKFCSLVKIKRTLSLKEVHYMNDSDTAFVIIVVVQSLSHVWLFVTLWIVACLASLSFTISQSLLKLMSTELVMLSNHFILCHPLLLLPSILPSNRDFSNESAGCIRWPKYWGFSFSISPSNDWFPLGLTGFISLQSKGLSRVFSNTTIWKHISSALSLLYGPILTSVHDYLKNHNLDYTDLCQKSDVSAF